MFNGKNLTFELRPRAGLLGLTPDLVMLDTQPSWGKKELLEENNIYKGKSHLYNKESGRNGKARKNFSYRCIFWRGNQMYYFSESKK